MCVMLDRPEAEPTTPTVFALSSGRGRAGIAVVRLSGPRAGDALVALARRRGGPRMAALRTLRHPETGETLDQALTLWLPGPASETGEDMAELHLHGSPAVIRAVLGALGGLPGCRLAEPGEFARRAFENGRMDLTAAEGLADLIEAETDAQRRQALSQASGALGRLYEGWRARLIEAHALCEAGIDFTDEGDVGSTTVRNGLDVARDLAMELRRHLDDGHRGEIVREGFRVALCGPPNAGKSSLLNALAKRDAAIVSDEPGTTRDTIEVRLDLGGHAVIVTDTAGIRATTNAIEIEGIRRTLAAARGADLVLWLTDARAPVPIPNELGPNELRSDERAPGSGLPLLLAANKVDLVPAAGPGHTAEGRLNLSALTGAGLGDLVAFIQSHALAAIRQGEGPAITQARHRLLVQDCADAIDRALAAEPLGPELVAEELRHAERALGRLTGRIDAEDVLDQIFSRFCIGK